MMDCPNCKARRPIAFESIKAGALANARVLVERWLPDGRAEGNEWSALNPKRADRRRGSFKVNLHSGRWGDFAADASGGDLISLAAYLFNLHQSEAAHRIAEALGMPAHD